MPIAGRIIALEIRTSKFGFAVLEGRDRLLDWGVRTFGEDVDSFESTLSDRFSTLFAFYDPAVIVIRDRELQFATKGKKIQMIIKTLKQAMQPSSAKLRVLTTSQIRDRFELGSSTTKHDIAKSLTERFEELSFKLPNKRKAYQSEAPVMLVFDALATAVAFSERTAAHE